LDDFVSDAERFPTAVRRELAFLLSDHDFSPVSEETHIVSWESPTLGLQAVWDPRGEVAVSIFLRELGQPSEGWNYTGMVGRASVARLLQLSAESMKTDPAVLSADVGYYTELAAERRRRSREWTAYYARKGPRPVTGHLP
jgi:hypothetical protein